MQILKTEDSVHEYTLSAKLPNGDQKDNDNVIRIANTNKNYIVYT